MTISQVTSFIEKRCGVLYTSQRIDYFWALGKVRVENVVYCITIVTKTHRQHLGTCQ